MIADYYPIIKIEGNKIVYFETWHKVNGEYIHIVQDYKNKKFYTNGKLEE